MCNLIHSMDVLQLFKCLGDDTRLKCVMLIHCFGEACVCELMEALALDQPKISRHLAQLRKCGILLDERRGKWMYYRLQPELSKAARAIISTAVDCQNNEFDALKAKFTRCQISDSRCC